MDPLFYHSKQEQKNIFDGVEESIINKKNDGFWAEICCE